MLALIVTKNIKYESIYNIDDTNFNLEISSYKIDGNKLSFEFSGKEKLVGNYLFKSEKEKKTFYTKYSIGDELNITGKLKKPKNNTIPNTFNYKKYLLNKKIYYTLDIEDFNLKAKNKNIFNSYKNYVYNRINEINNNEYIYALVLGESLYIDSESYRINGVSHLFSLSGLHVSLIASMLLYIIKLVKKTIKKRKNPNYVFEENLTMYLIVFIFLLSFAFITNFKPSFIRAIMFFILMGINKIYYYNIRGENLLIIVYILMVIINPFYIYDISFQLSWTITFFLFFTSELYKSNNYILKLLWASFISLLSSLPIIINNFYTINLLSILNNLFFVPYVTYIVYPISLLTIIISPLNQVLVFFTNILEKVSHYLMNINVLNISFSKLSFFQITLYYLFFLLIIKSRKKLKYICCIFLLLVYSLYKPNFHKDTIIYFLDVGQGDSALIVTRNKQTILIDTGGYMKYETPFWAVRNKNFNLMNSNIIPFFKSIGVQKIDFLFLTHGDDDHAGYSKDLIENFNVNNIIINKGEKNDLEVNLNYKDVKSKYLIDNIIIYSLNDKDYKDENQNSLILLIIINNKKILFMGDATIKQEKYIINKYNLNNIDILKVGHHGSSTSSSSMFINEINPENCIISVGENNKFGHPKEEVLMILKKCNIYRTDLNGSIEIKFKKDNYTIKTNSPQKQFW